MCAGSWQCVVRSFSLRETQFGGLRRKEKAFLHFAGAKRRRAQQKSGFAPLQILLGNIAARIRSLNFVGKVTGVPVPVLAQTPLLGILVRFRGILRIKFLIVAVLVITCNGNRAFGEVKVARKLAISRQSPRPKIKGFT